MKRGASRAAAVACAGLLVAGLVGAAATERHRGRVDGNAPSADTRLADVEQMVASAQAFLAVLDDDQRAAATFPLDSEERSRFHFIPVEMFERPGVMLADMTDEQRARAHDLLAAGLSQEGHLTVRQIMELEDVLLALEGGGRFARDRDEYLFAFYGEPSVSEPWAWRFEGHHLSLHFTAVGGDLAVLAPAFAGASPAEVRGGPQRGRRVLGNREDAGRAVVRALSVDQRRAATIAAEAPRDIVTGAEAVVDPLEPEGILGADLDGAQRGRLRDLIEVYLGLMADDLADRRRSELLSEGLDAISFGWAGGVEPGEPHYYRVQGPTFLIEYDNTQNGANHVHSVWRDFEGDFGRDLLREHRARHPHD